MVSLNLNREDILDRSVRVAAREGKLEILKQALEQGADINSQADNGATALMNASAACFPKVVAYLIKNKANLNIQDNRGRDSTHACLKSRLLACGQTIIEINKSECLIY